MFRIQSSIAKNIAVNNLRPVECLFTNSLCLLKKMHALVFLPTDRATVVRQWRVSGGDAVAPDTQDETPASNRPVDRQTDALLNAPARLPSDAPRERTDLDRPSNSRHWPLEHALRCSIAQAPRF